MQAQSKIKCASGFRRGGGGVGVIRKPRDYPLGMEVRRGRPPYPGVLTPAEERVLDLVRSGLTNAEIAVRLGLSISTVRYHLTNLHSKANSESREALRSWQP